MPSQRSWDTAFTRMGGVEGQTEGWDRWPVPERRYKNMCKEFYVGLRTGLISHETHETVESIFSNRSQRLKGHRVCVSQNVNLFPLAPLQSDLNAPIHVQIDNLGRVHTHTHTQIIQLCNEAMTASFTLLCKHNLLQQVPRLNLGGYKSDV